MKITKILTAATLAAAFLAAPLTAFAADKKAEKDDKKPVKKYTLKNCLISDEGLDSMGEPYVFEHKGQEIKLCCKACKKDFDKNTKKYLKKLEDEEKKASKPKA